MPKIVTNYVILQPSTGYNRFTNTIIALNITHLGFTYTNDR